MKSSKYSTSENMYSSQILQTGEILNGYLHNSLLQIQLNRISELPKVQSDQLGEPGAAAAHVELGPGGADEMLHRVILRSVTYTLRVPSGNVSADAAVSGGTGDNQLRPTLTYDVSQMLDDIVDNYLKNKARIAFIV